MRKTLIKKKQRHMWFYFYSHSVCWYKVIHLSQTSSVWVVKVKADLTLHWGTTGHPISKMISQANINRPIPVSIWQFPPNCPAGPWSVIHRAFQEAPFPGFLSQTRGVVVFFLQPKNTSMVFCNLEDFVLKNTSLIQPTSKWFSGRVV